MELLFLRRTEYKSPDRRDANFFEETLSNLVELLYIFTCVSLHESVLISFIIVIVNNALVLMTTLPRTPKHF